MRSVEYSKIPQTNIIHSDRDFHGSHQDIGMSLSNRKCQDYAFVNWEYLITM